MTEFMDFNEAIKMACSSGEHRYFITEVYVPLKVPDYGEPRHAKMWTLQVFGKHAGFEENTDPNGT